MTMTCHRIVLLLEGSLELSIGWDFYDAMQVWSAAEMSLQGFSTLMDWRPKSARFRFRFRSRFAGFFTCTVKTLVDTGAANDDDEAISLDTSLSSKRIGFLGLPTHQSLL